MSEHAANNSRQPEVMSGYLVVPVDGCTCDGGGEFPHRAECGYEPAVPLSEVEAALARAGRAVVEPPEPIASADEHTDVKTWEPDGVDFQVNMHPGDEEKDTEVAFAYWRVSPAQARSIGLTFLAAAELGERPGGSLVGEQHDE